MKQKLIIGYLLLLFLSISLTSCSQTNTKKDKVQEDAVQFINYLKDNNEKAIFEVTYHTETQRNISEEDIRKRDVKRAADLIKKYGLPPKDKWVFGYNPNDIFDRYTVTVPFYENHDTSKRKAEIYFAFPPRQISDKIFKYEVRTFEPLKIEPTIAPPGTISDK